MILLVPSFLCYNAPFLLHYQGEAKPSIIMFSFASVLAQSLQVHLPTTEYAHSEKHCNIFFLWKTPDSLNKNIYYINDRVFHPGVNSKTIILGKLQANGIARHIKKSNFKLVVISGMK